MDEKRILFVCAGNTCRSPFAEGLFNKRAGETGLNFRAESAGMAVFSDGGANANSIAAAGRYGFDLSNHRARQLGEGMLERAFRVYTMEASQRDTLCRRHPGYAEKIFSVAEDIADPFGGEFDDYLTMAGQADQAVSAIIAELERGANGNNSL